MKIKLSFGSNSVKSLLSTCIKLMQIFGGGQGGGEEDWIRNNRNPQGRAYSYAVTNLEGLGKKYFSADQSVFLFYNSHFIINIFFVEM